MPRGFKHNCKGNRKVDVLCEELVGLSKYTATQRFLLVGMSYNKSVEWKQMTECYGGYM